MPLLYPILESALRPRKCLEFNNFIFLVIFIAGGGSGPCPGLIISDRGYRYDPLIVFTCCSISSSTKLDISLISANTLSSAYLLATY